MSIWSRASEISLALTLFVSVGSASSAAPLHCEAAGAAQLIVPDLFAQNPSAQKLGLEVTDVRLIGTLPGASCLIEVHTNRGYTFKYEFRLGEDGAATLDMVP